ncbi:hypothetical protein PsYK624_123000 [Phanerochaete sordida]|uniref:Plastocyanin-like domain-containing protein n=1 Tax=Phanerochaete sordida TaxID=48140 RepID=A0A9P3GJ46_9APHY|nr:hypothetical protein PsYK624_123000 [Phanerochaete sordida]
MPSLEPITQDNFVLNGLAGHWPPQTHSYDFVVSQIEGATDGLNRPMLVVEDMHPGPTVQANLGDRIVVNVTDMLQNRTAIHRRCLFKDQTTF